MERRAAAPWRVKELLDELLEDIKAGETEMVEDRFRSTAILRRSGPAACHTNRVRPPGLDRRPLFNAYLELPEIAEVILIQEPFIGAEMQVGELDFSCVVSAGNPEKAWHGIILFPDAQAVEVGVGPDE